MTECSNEQFLVNRLEKQLNLILDGDDDETPGSRVIFQKEIDILRNSNSGIQVEGIATSASSL